MKTKTYFIISAVSLNVILFVFGLFDIFDSWPLYQIPLWQVAWLYSLGDKIGLDVIGKSNEFAPVPNILGGLLF